MDAYTRNLQRLYQSSQDGDYNALLQYYRFHERSRKLDLMDPREIVMALAYQLFLEDKEALKKEGMSQSEYWASSKDVRDRYLQSLANSYYEFAEGSPFVVHNAAVNLSRPRRIALPYSTKVRKGKKGEKIYYRVAHFDQSWNHFQFLNCEFFGTETLDKIYFSVENAHFHSCYFKAGVLMQGTARHTCFSSCYYERDRRRLWPSFGKRVSDTRRYVPRPSGPRPTFGETESSFVAYSRRVSDSIKSLHKQFLSD